MSFRDQYDAAHRSAILRDGSSTGAVVITGADRRSFLHALLTNDISALAQGSGTYAAYLTPQGRMITDMRVVETGDQILLAVEPSIASALAQRLDQLVFSEDVQVEDRSGELDVIGVHGPAAAAVIESALQVPVAELTRNYANVSAEVDVGSETRARVTAVRDDGFGVPGFDVYVPARAAGRIRGNLVESGATPAGEETFESLRLEAGRPRFGIDMTDDTIPLEAGIEDRAISFTKGCYVGQEVIVRVLHRGHGRVARRLVRLVLSGSQLPSRGDKVLAADREVGAITSAAESPRAGAPLAMAYVHRDFVSGDVQLSVNGSKAALYQAGN